MHRERLREDDLAPMDVDAYPGTHLNVPVRHGNLQPADRAVAVETIVEIPRRSVVLLLGRHVCRGQHQPVEEIHTTRGVGHGEVFTHPGPTGLSGHTACSACPDEGHRLRGARPSARPRACRRRYDARRNYAYRGLIAPRWGVLTHTERRNDADPEACSAGLTGNPVHWPGAGALAK